MRYQAVYLPCLIAFLVKLLKAFLSGRHGVEIEEQHW
jgi:hypothetical protein